MTEFRSNLLNRPGACLRICPGIFLVLLTALVLLVHAPMAQAQELAYLPDAPRPQAAEVADGSASAWQEQNPPAKPDPLAPPAQADAQAASPITHASFEERKWAQYVDPGERIPPLYPRDKWVFWLHEEARWSSTFPAFVSAGYGQLTGTPAYGSDSEAFGKRVGAALVRQASMRFFCSSLFPVYLGEDPRYFRKASGGYMGRAGWATERAFITQRDSGSHSFNFSNVFGHLAASALTQVYYPSKSRSVHVVMQTWGTSIAGSAANNLFLEFVPDALNAWHSRKHSKDSAGMESRGAD
jgi:hypothetical protein